MIFRRTYFKTIKINLSRLISCARPPDPRIWSVPEAPSKQQTNFDEAAGDLDRLVSKGVGDLVTLGQCTRLLSDLCQQAGIESASEPPLGSRAVRCLQHLLQMFVSTARRVTVTSLAEDKDAKPDARKLAAFGELLQVPYTSDDPTFNYVRKQLREIDDVEWRRKIARQSKYQKGASVKGRRVAHKRGLFL